MADDLGFAVRTKIGTAVANLEDTKVQPTVQFIQAAETRRVLCGESVPAEPPSVRWMYPDMRLTGAQFHQLKKFVGSNMSADVVIQTPVEEIDPTTYEPIISTYNAIMHWPVGVESAPILQWTFPEDGILFTNLTPAT